MPNDKCVIDSDLVRHLISTQFPKWSDLPIKVVAMSGWDNRTFHLGDHMLVRLPSAESYASAVQKEQTWLPRLAPFLPLKIPEPLAMGKPDDIYPWPWSIYGNGSKRAYFSEQLTQFIHAKNCTILGFFHRFLKANLLSCLTLKLCMSQQL